MSIIAEARAALAAAVAAAEPDVALYPESLDDIQESPCIIFDLAGIQRSYQSAGASVVRIPIWVVAYRGAPSETVPSLDDLTASVWEAVGGGGSLVLQGIGGAQPQSGVVTPLNVGGTEWPAVRIDVDVTVSRALC